MLAVCDCPYIIVVKSDVDCQKQSNGDKNGQTCHQHFMSPTSVTKINQAYILILSNKSVINPIFAARGATRADLLYWDGLPSFENKYKMDHSEFQNADCIAETQESILVYSG